MFHVPPTRCANDRRGAPERAGKYGMGDGMFAIGEQVALLFSDGSSGTFVARSGKLIFA
jgi:hypothetical protein